MNSPAAAPPELSDARRKKILKRISTARLVVNSYCRFFAHLVGKTTVVIAEPHHNVPTAAVSPDGYVYFNPDFVDKLSDPELAGLVVHETLHPALLCWKRQGSRKAMLELPDGQIVGAWNLAHDLSFNPEIVALADKCRSKGKIKLPKHAALESKYEGKSAEVIYDDLLKTAKKSQKPQPGVAGKLTSMPGGDAAMDGIGDDLREDLAQSETGKRAARGDKTSQQKLQNEWRVSVIAAALAHERKHGRGHLPAGIAKMVSDLLECKIDWVEVLSQWLGENGNKMDITYRRPRRRFDPNVLYLPSYQKFGVDDVVVLWDTSGSMGGREKEILSEIQGICEELGLSLCIICIDSQIHSITRDVKEATDMIGKIKGGGGSNFTPGFDHLETECFQGVVVAFTDGHIGVPDCKPPLIRDVLWCIEPKSKGGFGDVDPTDGRWGQVLLMEDQ
jgi:predicted metal-dependent peptidase